MIRIMRFAGAAHREHFTIEKFTLEFGAALNGQILLGVSRGLSCIAMLVSPKAGSIEALMRLHPIQGAIADRFGQMLRFDPIAAGQIGNGTRDF